MPELDEDNDPALPVRRGLFRQMDRTEMMLSVTGVALAAFAAFFPWYVFFHHEYFVVRHDGLPQHLLRDLPVGPPRPVFSVSPSASININEFPAIAQGKPGRNFDDIKTATIPEKAKPNAAQEGEKAAMNQPLPGAPKGFRLLHVAGGRALIDDGSGMYIVGVGAVLPDNSRIEAIEQRQGQWVLVTSKGETIGMN